MKYASLASCCLVTVFAAFSFTSLPAEADPAVVVRPGQWTPISNVYWIGSGCQSKLNKVVDVQILSGSENINFTLQPQTVKTFQCGNDVPGAVVLAEPKRSTPSTVQLRYVVNYDTVDGPKMSAHVKDLKIEP